MQNGQRFQAIESLIFNLVNPGVIEMEYPQVFPSDKSVALQIAKIVTIQKYFRGIHGETLWQLSELITGALNDIFRPGIVMITIATIRAGHFTVTRVKLAALAQRKAVSLIGA